MLRIIRLGKLTKLLKLLRLLKMMKNQSKILNQMDSFVSVDIGVNRIMFFCAMIVLMCHIIACLWIVQANMVESDLTWI